MGSAKRNLFRINVMIVFILFLSLLPATLRLEGLLFLAEAACSIILLLAAFILFSGITKNKRWAWPGMLVFFSIALANSAVLLVNSGSIRGVTLPLLMSAVGFVISITRKESEQEIHVETYEVKPEVMDIEQESKGRAEKKSRKNKPAKKRKK